MKCSTIYNSFERYGQTNNNIIQLVNVLFYNRKQNKSLVIPDFANNFLKYFDKKIFYENYCVFSGNKKSHKLSGPESYYMFHDSRGFVKSIRKEENEEKHFFTIQLYKDLFLKPLPELINNLNFALHSIYYNKAFRVRETLKYSFYKKKSKEFNGIQIRDFGKKQCEERITWFGHNKTEWCKNTHLIYSRCNKSNTFLSVGNEKLAANYFNKNVSYSLGERNSMIKLWVDLYMLSLSSCTILHPTSTFGKTVGYLKLSLNKSLHEVKSGQMYNIKNTKLNWY